MSLANVCLSANFKVSCEIDRMPRKPSWFLTKLAVLLEDHPGNRAEQQVPLYEEVFSADDENQWYLPVTNLVCSSDQTVCVVMTVICCRWKIEVGESRPKVGVSQWGNKSYDFDGTFLKSTWRWNMRNHMTEEKKKRTKWDMSRHRPNAVLGRSQVEQTYRLNASIVGGVQQIKRPSYFNWLSGY